MGRRHNNASYIKRFIKYLYPHMGGELLLFLLMVITSAGSLATPYILKIIIDDIFPKGNYTQLVWILLVLVVIYVVRILCAICTDVLFARISLRIIAAIRGDILRNILSRPIHFFRQVKPGDILFTVMNDVQNIQSAVSVLVLTFTTDLLTVIGIVIMLALLNLKLTIISFLILPIVILSIRKFTPLLQANFRKSQDLQEMLNNFVLEKIRNIRVVRSYNTAGYEQNNLDRLQQQDIHINTKNALLSSLNSNTTVFLVAIGPIIVLMYGGKAIFEGLLTIGALIAFIQYLNRLYSPAMNIMNSYNSFTKALVSMERVSKYMDDEQPAEADGFPTPDFQSIKFEHVSFVANKKIILEDVSLRFEKGKIYGIIGPSGSGKSTISSLLCDFIQPTSGHILLDDEVPVSTLSNWQESLGLIEKENQLFSHTILENVKYGTFDAVVEEVYLAAARAGLEDVWNDLPEGMDTLINENGTTLSDGQKQRISIARALTRRAKVIIFDEATAALDVQLEHRIISNLKTYHKDAVIIIITHRLQSLRSVDYVYVVNNGSIANEGAPEQFTNISQPNHMTDVQ